MLEVTPPVLIVHGERDQLVPSPAASWLSDALPNARLAVFPDAAHAPFLSHPREFAQILETFLNARK
jgi:pimeloyl-[acyl-carrier protein] methyl ester esterase